MRLWIVCLCLGQTSAWAQIVDDTTQVVRGYANTIFVTGQSVAEGVLKSRRLDTTLHQLQETDEWLYVGGERQKNLGYIGSPQMPLFYRHRQQVGRALGLGATQYLTFHPDSVRFYRNYNVLSRLRYNQGSYGRQWVQVELAKNIASNWNVGFNLRRLTMQRQIGVTTRREKQLDQTAYCLHFNGSAWKQRYYVFGSLSNFRQTNTETGGILANAQTAKEELFDFNVSQTLFPGAGVSAERVRNGRLYQILTIDSALPKLQVNAGFDSYQYGFKLAVPSEASALERLPYKSFFLAQDSTRNFYEYRLAFLQPELSYSVGSLHLKTGALIRNHRYANARLNVARITETILSVQARYEVGAGEVSAKGQWVPGRDRSIVAGARWPGWFAEVGTAAISPTFAQQQIISNHFLWLNDFKLEQVLHAEAGFVARLRGQSFLFALRNQTIRNGIFFGDSVRPFQEGSAVNNLVLKAEGRLVARTFRLNLWVQAANPSRMDLLPQPRLFARASPAFLFNFKQGRYQVNPGMDFWYRTAFNGQAWEPSLGVFHLQGQGGGLANAIPRVQTLEPYLWTSVFVNLKINNTRGYVKVGNLLQGITGLGYFDVPFYPGQRRYFEFGLDWVFFD